MRQIGTLPDKDAASRFSDYLLTLGITSRVDSRPSGNEIWVHHEDKVPQAKQEFEEFVKDSSNPRYQGVEGTARSLRKKKEEEDRRHIRNSVALRGVWAYRPPERVPITFALLAASAVAFVFVSFGTKSGALWNELLIAPVKSNLPAHLDPETRRALENEGAIAGLTPQEAPTLSRVKRGEVWRLVTPIFLHFSIWHLLFCFYWFNDIGGMVEIRKGTPWFAALVLLIAIPSNLAQYAVEGPRFGGLMPVILGLFAYVWIQKQYIPNANLPLRANTEIILGLGFLVSLSGFGMFFGPRSGAADLVGAGVGLVLGAIPVLRRRLIGRR
jgi:GlpG protein